MMDIQFVTSSIHKMVNEHLDVPDGMRSELDKSQLDSAHQNLDSIVQKLEKELFHGATPKTY